MHRSLNVAHLLFSLILLLSIPSGIQAQTIDTEAFRPEIDSLNGKLLFMTECHEVRTNYAEHQAVISKITAGFTSSDTLNVFLEAPFTLTYFINQYVAGKNRILVDSILRNDPYKIEFYFSMRKLKKNIRFIGADFEYDQGKPGGRFESFKLYFDDLKKVFETAGIDLSVIKSFIYGIKVQGLEEADFYTFKKYIQKLSINQADPVLKSKLKEANFVLAALQSHEKPDVRDKAYYSRILELIKSGVSISDNINIMSFGSAHGNPYNEKCLYSKLNSEDDSPFKGKVDIFANIYYNSLSYGSYNDKSIVLETVGLYYGSKEDKQIIDLVLKNYKPEIDNSFTIVKNDLVSEFKDVDKVRYWGIHYKIK